MKINVITSGELNEAGSQLVAVGRDLAFKLKGRTAKRVIQLDGVTCIVEVKGLKANVIILSSETGFILHPRSGPIEATYYYRHYVDYSTGPGLYLIENILSYAVIGGWENGATPLSTSYLFPLVDTDNASFTITGEAADKQYAFSQPGVYGNIDWYNGDSENPVSITYRGTPSRHGYLSQEYEVPGFSAVERLRVVGAEEIPEFTVFGTAAYSGGDTLFTAPSFSWPYGGDTDNKSLLLGAAQDSNGTNFIVTLNNHEGAPAYAWYFSNGTSLTGAATTVADTYIAANPGVTIVKELVLAQSGYFLGVWCDKISGANRFRIDGWELINEFAYTRNGLCWFGNKRGTEFTASNGDKIVLTYNGAAWNAALSQETAVTGTYEESLPDTDRYELKFDISVSGIRTFCEYVSDTRTSSIASLTFEAYSIQHNGEWGATYITTGASGSGANTSYYLEELKREYVDTTSYCYVPYYDGSTPPYDWDPPGFVHPPCVKTDWLGIPLPEPNDGVVRAVWHSKTTQDWIGDLPGTEHFINTDFTVVVCGHEIPIVKTTRYWKDERSAHNETAAESFMAASVVEDCTIEKSTIHFLDQRYGVCLYKTVKDEIHLNHEANKGVDICHFVAYGSSDRTQLATIVADDYTAKSTETWYLIVDGIKSVVAESELELIPFGEPMDWDIEGVNAPEDVCVILSFPKLPATQLLTLDANELIYHIGCYEDGYDDPFGEQAQTDGGIDHFYPAWCRSLEVDPFWQAAASTRFSFTAPGATHDPSGVGPYTPPEITVSAIPVGSFARHPILGDMYQFLIRKFTGEHVVVSSEDINAKINEQLTNNQVTHDTTLYFPISVI